MWLGPTPGPVGSPLTTKGDVYGFTTVDARLAVGTDGQVVVADSAEGLGIKWDDHGIWKTDWTPTYANITVGNGTVVARYVEIGDFIRAQFMLTFGSTTTMGSSHTISLPVTADASFTAGLLNLGPAILDEAGGNARHGYARRQTSTTCRVQIFDASTTHLQEVAVTATVPFTWGTGDILSFNIVLEKA